MQHTAPQSPDEDELLTVLEAAAKLKVSERTLRTRLAEGVIPKLTFTSRCVRIRRSDLRAYIDRSGPGGAVRRRE